MCFPREEGQEGEEEPVDPQPPARERARSHSKTKKARRERRHADRGAETTASATAALQPQTGVESQSQVRKGGAKSLTAERSQAGGVMDFLSHTKQCTPYLMCLGCKAGLMSFPLYRGRSQWRARRSRGQSQRPAVSLRVLPGSGAPSSGTAGHCTMTRRCLKAGPANSNRGNLDAQRESSMST